MNTFVGRGSQCFQLPTPTAGPQLLHSWVFSFYLAKTLQLIESNGVFWKAKKGDIKPFHLLKPKCSDSVSASNFKVNKATLTAKCMRNPAKNNVSSKGSLHLTTVKLQYNPSSDRQLPFSIMPLIPSCGDFAIHLLMAFTLRGEGPGLIHFTKH